MAVIYPQLSRKRVLIAGAGLASLTAVYELISASHEVLILETRQHPGKRIYTFRPLIEPIKREGEASWRQIYAEYDPYSVRNFLELKGWSEGMIEMFSLLNNQGF